MSPLFGPLPGDLSSDSSPLAVVYLLQDDQTRSLDLTGVSRAEQQRADRYRLEQKRRQYLFTRSAGRQVLATHFQVAPPDIQWNVAGPPVVIPGTTGVCASVSCSHSLDFSLLAIAKPQLMIGVDLEIPDPYFQPDSLAAAALTETERAALADLPSTLRSCHLLRSWTVKEAILKSLCIKDIPGPLSLELEWSQVNQAHTLSDAEAEQDEEMDFAATSFAGRWWLEEKLAVENRRSPAKGRENPDLLGVGWRGGLVKQEDSGNLGCRTGLLAVALRRKWSSQTSRDPAVAKDVPLRLEISKFQSNNVGFWENASSLRDVFTVTIKAPHHLSFAGSG